MSRHHVRGMLLAVLCTAVVASCSQGPTFLPVYPVKGQVLVNGKPAPGAFVVLHPLDGPSASTKTAIRPSGRCDKDGYFTTSTYKENDGAPAGTYAVTISWVGPRVKQREPGEEGVEEDPEPPPSILPEKYGTKEATDLRATVTEGSNDLGVYKITR